MTARDPEVLKQKLEAFARDFAFFKHMGFELEDFGPRWARAHIALRDELKNPNGVMHGGVLATLIDATITQSMLMTDEYQAVRDSKGSMSNIDLRVKYLRPLVSGSARCEARISHLGKRVAHASAVVTTEDGKEVAMGDAILLISLGTGA